MNDARLREWLRLGHRALTVARAVVRDPDLEGDHAGEVARAKKLHGLLDSVARQVVGCDGTPVCNCPLCREERPHD